MNRRRFAPAPARRLPGLALASTLLVFDGMSPPAADSPPPEAANWRPLPDSLIRAEAADITRFRSGSYAFAYLGPGLLASPPEGAFQAMLLAADRGELYKALYLGRVVTRLRPDLEAAWTNRAAVAETLGFQSEAAAARRRRSVQRALPGQTFVRPRTIRDWAAAMALVDDDVVASDGPHALVAVQAGISGYNQVVTEETTTVRSAAVMLDDLLPNLFVVRSAEPMHNRSRSGWNFVAALGQAVAATALSGRNPLPADVSEAEQLFDTLMERQNEAAIEAARRPSHLEGGMFVARSFRGVAARNEIRRPRPTGGFNAVDYPLGLPWASGGSLNGVQRAKVVATRGAPAECSSVSASGRRAERALPSDVVSFGKLVRLCLVRVIAPSKTMPTGGRDCEQAIPPLTLAELMLDREDEVLLFPWLQDTRRSVESELPLEDLYKRNLLGVTQRAVVVDSRGDPCDFLVSEWVWIVPSNTNLN